MNREGKQFGRSSSSNSGTRKFGPTPTTYPPAQTEPTHSATFFGSPPPAPSRSGMGQNNTQAIAGTHEKVYQHSWRGIRRCGIAFHTVLCMPFKEALDGEKPWARKEHITWLEFTHRSHFFWWLSSFTPFVAWELNMRLASHGVKEGV